ncbi:MAG: autotransporter-associated beta strand repeat-containing protein, partial [Verrucomicrobiota bacterium]
MAFYRSIALLLGLLSLLLFSEGATIAWDAGGTPNNDWSIGQNWSTDALPANTDDVNFSASSGTILTSGNRIVNNFTLSSGSQILLKGGASGTDTLKINGGSITFQGAAHVLGATGANALGIVLGANTTLYVTTGGPQPSISGVISESGGSFKLIKDATSNATLFLQAANTFTGGVDINQGNLAITNSQALGTGTVTMASSTVLAWATATAPSSSVANNITFSGTSAILGFQGSNNGGMTLNFSGNLTSNVALTSNLTFTAGSNAASNQAEGTVMLSGNNSGLSQATNVYAISRYNLILSGANAAPGAGSFSMGSSAAANYFTRLLLDNSASSSNNITVTNGGAGAVAVDTIGGINTSGTTTFSGTITTNDSTAGKTFLTAATGGETDFTGKITDGASTIDIEKMGGGTVKLSNATSDYNGKTIVRAGTLIASGNAPVSSNSVIGNAASAIQLGDTRPSLSTVRVATTVMGTIFTGFSYTGTNQIVFTTGPTTIDGVALANGDRILMKDAPNPAANGIWVRTSQNQWDRATDMDTNGEVLYGMQISVTSGTLYGGNTFWLTTSTAPTINTTNLYFEADTLDPNVAFLTDGANTIARDLTVVANNSSGTSTIGGTNTSGIALLSGAVTLNRDLQLTAASGGRVNFTGILDDTAGSFSVTKINGGTVALTNANT